MEKMTLYAFDTDKLEVISSWASASLGLSVNCKRAQGRKEGERVERPLPPAC